jgi:hypothetical protein
MYGLKCFSVESLQAYQHVHMIHNSCLNGRNHSGISVHRLQGDVVTGIFKDMWCERMNWINLVHDRGYWPDAVNTVFKCRIRYRARNFVISWETSSLTSHGGLCCMWGNMDNISVLHSNKAALSNCDWIKRKSFICDLQVRYKIGWTSRFLIVAINIWTGR